MWCVHYWMKTLNHVCMDLQKSIDNSLHFYLGWHVQKLFIKVFLGKTLNNKRIIFDFLLLKSSFHNMVMWLMLMYCILFIHLSFLLKTMFVTIVFSYQCKKYLDSNLWPFFYQYYQYIILWLATCLLCMNCWLCQ